MCVVLPPSIGATPNAHRTNQRRLVTRRRHAARCYRRRLLGLVERAQQFLSVLTPSVERVAPCLKRRFRFSRIASYREQPLDHQRLSDDARLSYGYLHVGSQEVYAFRSVVRHGREAYTHSEKMSSELVADKRRLRRGNVTSIADGWAAARLRCQTIHTAATGLPSSPRFRCHSQVTEPPVADGVALLAMDTINQDLRDVYEHVLSKGASEATALDATLGLARDLMPAKDDYTVRDTVSRVIAEVRIRRAPPGS